MSTVPPAAPFDRLRKLIAMLPDLRAMLDKIQAMFPTATLGELLEILTELLSLFPPPDLNDEVECRDWCRQAVIVAGHVAAIVPGAIDDEIVAVCSTIVTNDEYWAAAWTIKTWIMGLVGDEPNAAPPMAANELAARLNIDWQKLMALIQAIIDFINSWTKTGGTP